MSSRSDVTGSTRAVAATDRTVSPRAGQPQDGASIPRREAQARHASGDGARGARDESLRAVRRLAGVDLSPSEAVAVVRAARRLPGSLDSELAPACDALADDYRDREQVHRQAARRLRTGE